MKVIVGLSWEIVDGKQPPPYDKYVLPHFRSPTITRLRWVDVHTVWDNRLNDWNEVLNRSWRGCFITEEFEADFRSAKKRGWDAKLSLSADANLHNVYLRNLRLKIDSRNWLCSRIAKQRWAEKSAKPKWDGINKKSWVICSELSRRWASGWAIPFLGNGWGHWDNTTLICFD